MSTIRRTITALRNSRHFNPESGQIIILLAIASVGLIAIMGLAIDGGRLLFERRDAQNAADAAAMAAARALCTNRDPYAAGFSAARANDFDNDGVSNWVTISSPPTHADFPIAPECAGCYVEVNVTSQIPPSFIGLVYKGDMKATGYSIGVCNTDIADVSNRAPELRAIWAMSETCSPLPVTVTGNNIYIEGGAHSNGKMRIMPSQGGGTVIGATSVVIPYSVCSCTYVHGQDKVSWSPGSGSGSSSGGSQQTPTGTCLSSCFKNVATNVETIPATGKPYVTTKKEEYPVDFTIADFQLPNGRYAQAANALGQYYEFPCTGKFWDWVLANHSTKVGNTTKLDDGIYYAACNMDITKSADNVTGNVTFVSTGTIDVKGDGQHWQPYQLADKLIMFANSNEGCNGNGAVKFAGNNNSWNGIIFAPGGSIKMSASTNNSNAGCLVGLSVEVSGSSNRIVCDTSDSKWEPQPGIWLRK